MHDDIFIARADEVLPATFAGQRASSVTIATGVSIWEAERRGQISNVCLTKCSAAMVSVGPVILSDCRVEDSKTTRHHAHFYGTAFANCSFHGN